MKKNLANKYLSIGEVSKIMHVSHTSLRYYDEIGILKPAYINQDTGYRYYAKNQMPILSFILLAIDLDIPLKELEIYLDVDNSADLEEFALYAKRKIKNSIKKLQRDLYFLDKTQKHFKENEKNFEEMNSGKEYIKKIDTRYFLTLPFEYSYKADAFDVSSYWKIMTELYMLIYKYELSSSVEQGVIYYKEKNKIIGRVFVEIKKVKKKIFENADVLSIPKSDYFCSFYSDSSIEEASDKYLYQPSFIDGNFLIISDVLEKKMSKKIMLFEVQIIKK